MFCFLKRILKIEEPVSPAFVTAFTNLTFSCLNYINVCLTWKSVHKCMSSESKLCVVRTNGHILSNLPFFDDDNYDEYNNGDDNDGDDLSPLEIGVNQFKGVISLPCLPGHLHFQVLQQIVCKHFCLFVLSPVLSSSANRLQTFLFVLSPLSSSSANRLQTFSMDLFCFSIVLCFISTYNFVSNSSRNMIISKTIIGKNVSLKNLKNHHRHKWKPTKVHFVVLPTIVTTKTNKN